MGWNLGKWLKRATTVPERWRKCQPLRDVAEALGISKSYRDVVNATWRAAGEELAERFALLARNLDAATRAQLVGIALRLVLGGRIDWQAEEDTMKARLQAAREELRAHFDVLLGGAQQATADVLADAAMEILTSRGGEER